MARAARRRRVMLVDDSPFVRRALGRVLREDPSVEVVGEAADGLEALGRAELLRPDVVLLDLGLPGLDGLTVLSRLRAQLPEVAVVVVSAATQAGAEATVAALAGGAFDVVDKSSVSLMELHSLKSRLLELVAAATPPPTAEPGAPRRAVPWTSVPPRLICLGASTGGPQALAQLAAALPANLPCPVVVVQHIASSFVSAFAERLGGLCALPTSVVAPGEELRAGRLYIAPGGADLVVEADGERLRARASPAPRDALHAPTVDALFASAARAVGSRAVGILLTGMGRDGAEGLLALRRAGAVTIAEHASTCAVWGMPRAASELGAALAELPLHDIARGLAALGASNPFSSSPSPFVPPTHRSSP